MPLVLVSGIAALDTIYPITTPLEWVGWFNNQRLLEPIGNIPLAEAEKRYYAIPDEQKLVA